jgi:hypothetical protein
MIWQASERVPLSQASKAVDGSDGLRHFAVAMNHRSRPIGGTTPSAICEVIAEDTPSVYGAWGHMSLVCFPCLGIS